MRLLLKRVCSWRWGPVVLWSLLIFIGSAMPGASVSQSELVDYLIHKSVHLFEYAMLAVLTYRASHSWLLAFSYPALFAASDEFHQLFVPGRNGRLEDWLLDFFALSCGNLLSYLIERYTHRLSVKNVVSSSMEETQQVAANILKQLRGRHTLALFGDLGSGKTVFVQGLARALGVKETVNSPTFTLIKEYPLNQGTGQAPFARLIHADLYRLSENEAGNLGLSDYLNDRRSLVVIEWADRLNPNAVDSAVKIQFKYLDGQKRQLSIWL